MKQKAPRQTEAMMNLPSNYLHIDPTVAVHISTIRRFSADTKELMSYLTIANQYDFSNDPDALNQVTARSGMSTSDLVDRMREHAQIQLAITGLLQGGSWPYYEPEPVLLQGDSL
jgi:hypothetical protein